MSQMKISVLYVHFRKQLEVSEPACVNKLAYVNK